MFIIDNRFYRTAEEASCETISTLLSKEYLSGKRKLSIKVSKKKDEDGNEQLLTKYLNEMRVIVSKNEKSTDERLYGSGPLQFLKTVDFLSREYGISMGKHALEGVFLGAIVDVFFGTGGTFAFGGGAVGAVGGLVKSYQKLRKFDPLCHVEIRNSPKSFLIEIDYRCNTPEPEEFILFEPLVNAFRNVKREGAQEEGAVFA